MRVFCLFILKRDIYFCCCCCCFSSTECKTNAEVCIKSGGCCGCSIIILSLWHFQCWIEAEPVHCNLSMVVLMDQFFHFRSLLKLCSGWSRGRIAHEQIVRYMSHREQPVDCAASYGLSVALSLSVYESTCFCLRWHKGAWLGGRQTDRDEKTKPVIFERLGHSEHSCTGCCYVCLPRNLSSGNLEIVCDLQLLWRWVRSHQSGGTRADRTNIIASTVVDFHKNFGIRND